MSQVSHKTWIDVTDFLRWRGALTGFQHIQYNVAKYYLDNALPVGFFVYDESTRTFRAVDFDPDAVSKDGKIGGPEGSGQVAGGGRLITLAKRHTPHTAKKLAKRALAYRRKLTTRSSDISTTPSPFVADDAVIVLGGIWHGNFATDMATEKKRVGFRFYHFVHDMIPVVCPQYVVEDLPPVFTAYKDIIFRIADGLIANSESSKRDALHFMKQRGIQAPPFITNRLADAPDELTPVPVDDLKGKQFVLSLGTVEGRKNHALLYYVYKEAYRQGIELPTLAIAGRIGWLIDDIRYVISRDPDIKDKIIFLSDVTNSQRAWLLKNCLYSVWPSFYEGWGMPIAESLAYGKMCISSDTSSTPEAGGDFCVYLSPYNTQAWLEQMQMYCNPAVRKSFEERISKQYHITEWSEFASHIVDFVR